MSLLPNILYKDAENGKYTDLTLCLSDGTEIKCHRSVICTQCEFFANALKPGFKESSGVIHLKDDPPQAIRHMVKFFYTGQYTTTEQPENPGPDQTMSHDTPSDNEPGPTGLPPDEYAKAILAHAEVYIVSIIYRVPKLEDETSKLIKLALEKDNIIDVFPQLAQAIYSGVPDFVCHLRGDLIKYAEQHLVELTSKSLFQRMTSEAPELMEKIMHDLVEENKRKELKLKSKERRIDELEQTVSRLRKVDYKCPSCPKKFQMLMPDGRVKVGCPGCGRVRLAISWEAHKVREPFIAQPIA
ncbi:putative BTB/POZ domain-containing protein L85 [Lasiodiplodia theobromae]|uniref:Putative BTB/POZ domain-containing protein L85 n=1 Tax=Lasiodiplodia theobromae TaxID=45133 RepID=A0A5N5D7N2_9PEZI|nr:putative BTB/POZ domain-containing protein L85 [Lasiodiplodia theobromae]